MIEIGLGDYLRAVEALGAADDPALCRRVAAILGVEPRAAAVAERPRSITAGGARPGRTAVGAVLAAAAENAAGPTAAVDAPAAGAAAEEIEVVEVTASAPPAAPMPQLPAPAGPPPPLPYEPLFDPQRRRALIGAALAAARAEGEIDEPALIDQIASARPIASVPRRTRLTLARGAQVLVDLSPSMMPFRRDQDELLARIDRLVADGLLDVQTFDGDPGQTWSRRRKASAYEPPRPGTPVLALTDLGLRDVREGRLQPAMTWLVFAARLAQAQVPFIALVPYPPAALPRPMLDRIAVVQWDRPASVSSVQRAAARARRR
ncbi:MAG TPA: hypothetical protein VK932_19710 [Kofleriaceae bacterium]|nr:hypothetical protein [Kofleriaceae bacterium]